MNRDIAERQLAKNAQDLDVKTAMTVCCPITDFKVHVLETELNNGDFVDVSK